MNTKENAKLLRAFRRAKAKLRKSIPQRTTEDLTEMLLNPFYGDELDLDDDDLMLVSDELDRRGKPVIEGVDVPMEEIFDCPDCEELARECGAGRTIH